MYQPPNPGLSGLDRYQERHCFCPFPEMKLSILSFINFKLFNMNSHGMSYSDCCFRDVQNANVCDTSFSQYHLVLFDLTVVCSRILK
jgi:hypothetical protein